jgi:MFS family permease
VAVKEPSIPRLLLDLGPLRESRAFRRLWLGSALSGVGGQMTTYAVALQVFTLTHSSAAVGAVGLAAAIPSIVVGLLSGSIVDTVDRRRLVLSSTAGLTALSGLFAVQAFTGVGVVWPLYALVAVQSAISSVNGPASRTFAPRLLTPARVPAAAALATLAMHVSVTVGPVLAGLLTGLGGLRWCYLVDTLSFAGSLYAVARLPAMPPQGELVARPGLRAVVAGMRYIGGRPVLAGALLADLSAVVLGMPFALFPAVNADRFGGLAFTLGLLSAAPAVGGVLGSTLSGPITRTSRPGRGMLVCGAIWGAGLVGFGLAAWLWLALATLVLAGAADVCSVVQRTSIIQVATPDALRGRVSAAEYVVGVGGPQLGNARSGAVAVLFTPAVSAVSGGLATIAGAAVIAFAFPALTRYTPPDREPSTVVSVS